MEIVKASVTLAKSYCDAVDEVAREGKWLSVNKGFPLAESISFMKHCAATDSVQLFLVNGETVDGWCDIIPAGLWRTGSLGIGIRQNRRGKGYGARLLDSALAAAQKRFSRVILYVREDNVRAVALYLSRGFEVKKRYGKGRYRSVSEPVLMMVKKLKKKD